MIELLVGIALVGMAGFILGTIAAPRRLRGKNYKANWKPEIRAGGNTSSVLISIRKKTPPEYSKNKKYTWIEIGNIELKAENYQEEYARIMDIAQERAEFLNLEQNTYNYND